MKNLIIEIKPSNSTVIIDIVIFRPVLLSTLEVFPPTKVSGHYRLFRLYYLKKTMGVSAVLTGDIVNSTQLHKNDHRQLVKWMSAVLRGSTFDFYRGDCFQAYIKEPERALRIALECRLVARKFSAVAEARISIGIGQVKRTPKDLTTATEEAFIFSGRAFDIMVHESARLAIHSTRVDANTAFNVIADYADYLITQLTPKQAEVVLRLLQGQTQQQTANLLGKAQATINKHAHAAGWNKIDKLLKQYEVVLNQFSII